MQADAKRSSNSDSDRERKWLEGIRRSDLDCFKQVFEFYALRLRRFAAASVPEDQAEDMIQEVFLSLWERREELRLAPGELGKYLIGAMHKKIIQSRRNYSVRTNLLSARADELEDISPKPYPTDSQLLKAEFNAAFLVALNGLSEIQRQIVSLRWGEGMPYAKISEILGISENAAMLHATRIKHTLKPVLGRYLSGLE